MGSFYFFLGKIYVPVWVISLMKKHMLTKKNAPEPEANLQIMLKWDLVLKYKHVAYCKY